MSDAVTVHTRPTALIDNTRVRTIGRRFALAAFVAVLGYLVLVPLMRVQLLSLEDGAAGYRAAFTRPGIGRALLTTVQLAFGSLVIALCLGTALAVASTRLHRRVRFLRIVPILPLLTPFVAAIVGWTALFSPRPGYANLLLRKLPWWNHLDEGPLNIYSTPAIIVITGISLTSFVYLFVSSGLANINAELIESARTSRLGNTETFFKITLPLLRPVLIYGGAVALLLGLGQFTAPLLLGRNEGVNVLTTEMYYFTTQYPANYPAAAAMASPLIIFGLIVVFAQRWILGDQTRFVTHGSKGFKPSAGSSRVAGIGLAFYGLVTTVLPLAGLAYLSVSPFWRPKLSFDMLTLDNFRKVRDTSNLTEGITTSLVCSIGAVLIVLPIGFIASLVILKMRRHRVAQWLTELIIATPLGVPAAVFGVGFFYTYTRDPVVLYGSRWVIVLVYVTLMLPFATRMIMSAMVALGDSYEQAARVAGDNPLLAYVRIVIPMIRTPLVAAGSLIFVLLTHEFGASVLVRSPTTQVMGTALYDYWSNGSYPLTAAMAIVMTIITAIGVTLGMALSRGSALDRL